MYVDLDPCEDGQTMHWLDVWRRTRQHICGNAATWSHVDYYATDVSFLFPLIDMHNIILDFDKISKPNPHSGLFF
jgi:hypothetical protein